MTEQTDADFLRRAAELASRRPGYLAYDLAEFEELVGEDPANWLTAEQQTLERLALCRTPRRGSAYFAYDIRAIASHLGLRPSRLASLLRLADVLAQLRARTGLMAAPASALAAARDETDEHTVLSEGTGLGPGLPGWLHDAVGAFWSGTEAPSSYPRDLDFAMLVGLPLAVVELPELSVEAIAEWLATREVELELSGPDRRVRACLVALGGVGIVFVDARDDATQRRVSLAHEAAHFIVEYLLPRRDVARRRPELLAVLDGERPPTPKERLSAVLGDVPVGVHTHLLGLDSGGSVAVPEWRARRVALELLAPEAEVRGRAHSLRLQGSDGLRQLLVGEFGLPVSLADDYANQLSGAVNGTHDPLLDLLRQRASGADDTNQTSPGRTQDDGPEEEGQVPKP